MTELVRVAVAGDVAEAEEIQGILRAAGIDAESSSPSASRRLPGVTTMVVFRGRPTAITARPRPALSPQ